MAYTYTIMGYTGVEDDLRAIFGITETEFSDELIHRITHLPAAEIEAADRISQSLGSLTDTALTKAQLAVLYLAAANCLPAVRVNVLRVENDNKSMGQRFDNALDITELELRAKADKLIGEVEELLGETAASSVSLFDAYSPATDEITGA